MHHHSATFGTPEQKEKYYPKTSWLISINSIHCRLPDKPQGGAFPLRVVEKSITYIISRLEKSVELSQCSTDLLVSVASKRLSTNGCNGKQLLSLLLSSIAYSWHKNLKWGKLRRSYQHIVSGSHPHTIGGLKDSLKQFQNSSTEVPLNSLYWNRLYNNFLH